MFIFDFVADFYENLIFLNINVQFKRFSTLTDYNVFDERTWKWKLFSSFILHVYDSTVLNKT